MSSSLYSPLPFLSFPSFFRPLPFDFDLLLVRETIEVAELVLKTF